jgi:hypothetical protein
LDASIQFNIIDIQWYGARGMSKEFVVRVVATAIVVVG